MWGMAQGSDSSRPTLAGFPICLPHTHNPHSPVLLLRPGIGITFTTIMCQGLMSVYNLPNSSQFSASNRFQHQIHAAPSPEKIR
jgi:hypothetical protein